MRRRFFLLKRYWDVKRSFTGLIFYLPKCFAPLACLVFTFLFCSAAAYSQSPVPGIKVNGRILSTGDTLQVCIGTSISYINASQGYSSIKWNFKNGMPATSSATGTINVVYNTAGTDSTIQTVISAADTASMFVIIKVNNQYPAASFTFSPDNDCGNIPVVFNSSASSVVLSYLWDFGDGSTSDTSNPSHQFLNAVGASGTQQYAVKLKVTNGLNCSDSITKTVTIKKTPDAAIGNADPGVTFTTFNSVQTFRRCENTGSHVFQFVNATTTAAIITTYTIKWGDGSPDSTYNSWAAGAVISHLYTIGQREMTVMAYGNNGCIGIKKYSIFLGTTPAGGFASLGNTSICAPNTLRFVITGYQSNPNGTTYKFSVNDGTDSILYDNPPPDTVSHIFSTGSCGNTSSNGAQTFANAYRATLDVENPCGSTSVSVIPIYISGKPRAGMGISPSPNVCTGFPVIISNTTLSGGSITPTGGGNSTCSSSGKQVWTISPATGYTLTGSLGSTNGSSSNGLLWTSGSGSLTINFNTSGIYTVKLYVGNDQCGIDSITKTICVRNPPQASFTMNKKVSCGTDTAIITNTSPVGGCTGDTYDWTVTYTDPSACSTPGGNGYKFINGTDSTGKNPNIEFSKPGRYVITLTVDGTNTGSTCAPATFTDTFYVKARPAVKINPVNTVCAGNSISPSATVSNCYGSTPLTYNWTFTNGTPNSSPQLLPGPILYNLVGSHKIVFDVANECGLTRDSALAVIIAAPTANAGKDTSVCSGVAVKIGSAPVAGLTYQWTPSTGLSSTTSSNPSLTLTYNGPNADTTLPYIVTSFAGANCSGTDTVLVTIKKNPVVTVNPAVTQVCAGTATQLAAKGAGAYIWTPATGLNVTNRDTVIASPAATTIYTVTGTVNGCQATATATLNIVSFPAVFAGADTTVCNSSAAVQLAGTPAGGIWSGSPFVNASGVFNASAAGNGNYALAYTVTIGNCSKNDSVIVNVISAPFANAGADTSFCQNARAIKLIGLPAGGRWSGSVFVTPSGTFTPSSPGTHTLIYTIGGGTCTASDTVIITVTAGVVNNAISADQVVCAGIIPAVITGQVAAGGNTTPVYQWQSSLDSINWPDITGAKAKDYNPGPLAQTTLFRRIASTTACFGLEAAVSNTVTVTVNPNTKATFNPVNTKGCAPFVITPAVINLRIDSSVSEYRWYVNGNYIGNYNGTGPTFPGYVMNIAGDSITIRLVAISKFGCKSDTAQQGFITVVKPVTSFTQTDSAGCGPITVSFTNTTPNAFRYTFLWDFGQGQTSTLQQPAAITFPVNPLGTDTVYTVTLKAITSCDTITSVAFVRVKTKPKVLFTPDKSEGCSPMTVTFSNTSRGTNTNYVWNFGDGTPPVATNSATVKHTFSVGVKTTFSVKLTGMNECGVDSLMYAIVVNPNSIKIDFAVNGNERFGCAPHTVNFINNTTGATSFNWTFGDGSTLNTSKGIDTVSHTYTTTGNYTIILKAANACGDTTDTELVTVALKPKVSFTATPLAACLTDVINFKNTSDSTIVSAWKFGDGSTSSVRNPVKNYTLPGNYKVWLTGTNVYAQGSCSDSAFADVVIRDTLPGNIIVSDSVGSCTPFTISFKNGSSPSTQTTWAFGDGATATGDNVSHTYTVQGVYNVVMISRGTGGCIVKSTKTIRITTPAGTLIYAGGYVCQNTQTRFEIRATNTTQYRFVFGDGDSLTTTNPVVFHQYIKPGSYVPFAYLIAGNCLIKIFTGDTVKVESIHAGFAFTPQFSCGSTAVQFTDTSFAYFTIKSRQWNFGDGTTSSLANPLKTFAQSGLFNVRLVVTGMSGCTDTAIVPVTVNVRNFPVSSVLADSTGCTGQMIAANALVLSRDSVLTYSWNFGNNTTASGRNTTAVYNNAGTYSIRLISTTVYGCSDTAYQTERISISPIVNAGADVRICRGQSVQLQAFGAPALQWSPVQNLSCSTCANPVANPGQNTFYVVKGTNTFGCSATDTILVDVIQPAKVTISGNDTICTGQQTQLFASGALTYLWNPATGLSSGSVPNPVANPTVTTQYQVIGKDPYNCFSDTAYVTVAVGNYPTVNLGAGGLVVAGTQVTFNPTLTNGPFKTYTWTPIENLSCSNCPRPVATINTNVQYKLEVENIYGCKASNTITYTVRCEEATQVFVPNAFSPDNDGLNDVLMVRGKGLAAVKYFRIFNRWGQLVFERSNVNANDPAQGWDGTVNGKPANPDVYVYTVEVICTAGGVFMKKGNVTLFR